jgi:hypothetical protein
MAENNDQDNFDAENFSSAAASANKKASGRIFAVEEDTGPKINLDEEIEKNIKIRTMPKKFKVSSAGGDKKTKVVGAIIMVVGVLVMAAAVYLAYIYLINPQGKGTPAPTPTPPVTQTPTPTPSTPQTPVTNVPAQPTSPTVATSTQPTPPVNIPATSTPPVATSTPAVPASSTPPVATSTPPNPSAPIGAKNITALSIAEKALFGADPAKNDSDGDSYPDLSEVLNLYDPAGTGKIIDNPHIGVYQNPADHYSVDYPKNWKVQSLENGDSLLFTAADNSIVEIISQPNAQKQKIKDWYNGQFPDNQAADAQLAGRDGWQGIFHQDQENFYLADLAGNRIYTISYIPANPSDLSYYNIFLMMINSFTVK